uniref:Transcription factor spt8 n=1 Tax=Talaromyces marneffei PM1 TaxID=1077442 RepID=A0A093XAF7_TALMA
MASLVDEDDDRDIAGSQDGSSDNEDEQMRDVDDGDGDNEQDQEQEQDGDSPSNNSQTSEGAGGVSQQDTNATAETDYLATFRPTVRPECLTASVYDIVPTTAVPQSTSINTVTSTADMRWVFTGGSDGYIRKYNWVDSINGKLMLTVAQRHPFVDSVVKAGVLMNYWENMDGPLLSPVYSLAAQREGLWLLSGLESGSIRLQSVRHEEGKEIALLKNHTSAVSVLNLMSDEQSLLSGSWDKRVLEWDLNVGKVKNSFRSGASQISAIEIRPESNLPVPQDTMEARPSGTFSSNNDLPDSFATVNGTDAPQNAGDGLNPPAESPSDSLFGGTDSLFGDADGNIADGGAPSSDAENANDDALFGGSLEMNMNPPEQEPQGEPEASTQPNGNEAPPQQLPAETKLDPNSSSVKTELPPAEQSMSAVEPAVNGLPHAENLEFATIKQERQFSENASKITSDTTFLAASIDGPISIWDRRQPNPVARINPRNVPPWSCLQIAHVGGAVTALKAMPNGRHLLCASHDILRLYDLKEEAYKHSAVPFLVIPGHRTGVISQLFVDSTCRYMLSASGNRGWEGNTTEVLLGYEISSYKHDEDNCQGHAAAVDLIDNSVKVRQAGGRDGGDARLGARDEGGFAQLGVWLET